MVKPVPCGTSEDARFTHSEVLQLRRKAKQSVPPIVPKAHFTLKEHFTFGEYFTFHKAEHFTQKGLFCQFDKRVLFVGAGDEARTRYLHLGKVALYRMSYTRISADYSAMRNSKRRFY